MAADIQQTFSSSSAPADNVIAFPATAGQEQRTLVNYIWINKYKAVTDFAAPTSAIELANIKTALENAARHPEAQFNIWVDKKLLDDYSLLALTSFIKEFSKHDNVKLRDLQDIPDYASDPLFQVKSTTTKGYLTHSFDRAAMGSIYSRADYARILVLDHCLQTAPPHSNILYSDIDAPDLHLAEALPILKKYGIVVNDLVGKSISNGYIGVSADRDDRKEQFKILKERTREAAHKGELGYKIFREFLEDIGMPYDTWHDKIGLPRILPKMLTVPEHLAYQPPAAKVKAWKTANGI